LLSFAGHCRSSESQEALQRDRNTRGMWSVWKRVSHDVLFRLWVLHLRKVRPMGDPIGPSHLKFPVCQKTTVYVVRNPKRVRFKVIECRFPAHRRSPDLGSFAGCFGWHDYILPSCYRKSTKSPTCFKVRWNRTCSGGPRTSWANIEK
jgi:hypothetical protein